MAMSQFRQKGKEGEKDVQSLEKLGLYYFALNPLLGNARQLREFVVRAVQRMPPGKTASNATTYLAPEILKTRLFGWRRYLSQVTSKIGLLRWKTDSKKSPPGLPASR